MRRFAPFVVALFALLLAAAPAGAITNGVPDGDAHPYVGLIFNDEAFCTGTLLSPTVFLTAGHCTVLFANGDSPVYVTFDPNPSGNSTFYDVAQLFTMPGYGEVFPQLTGFSRNDIGIAILAGSGANLGEYGALPDQGLLDTLDKSTASFTDVGYGVQAFSAGPGGRQPSAYATRYRATMNEIGIPQAQSQVTDEFIHLTSNPGQGKGGSCFGDSGGPIFLDDTTTVVAVNSFVTNYNCAGQSYATRIDTAEALAFITQFLA
jgi:secreted trypsin-like serine protease